MSILVAVADDPMRDRVLDVAVELGRGLGQELYVVHLIEDASADRDARRVRDDVRSSLDDAGVEATVSVEQISHTGTRAGPKTARELLDAAADVHVTHIVMGHASKGLLGNLTEGSTAFAVADAAAIPVTLVPKQDDAE